MYSTYLEGARGFLKTMCLAFLVGGRIRAFSGLARALVGFVEARGIGSIALLESFFTVTPK